MNIWIFVWEWIFLDSGNIISDKTFCTMSQIMVEKFPNFRQNLSAFVSGWKVVDVGVTWLFWIMWHQLQDDSWDVQAGVPVESRPPLGCWGMLMASLILLLDPWSSLSNILASFMLQLWPVSSRCSPTAVLQCWPAVCSLYLVPRLLLISSMYILSQLSHFSWYTTSIAVPSVADPGGGKGGARPPRQWPKLR